MTTEAIATTVGRHTERLNATDKRIDGLEARLNWLIGLVVTILVGVIGILARGR